MVTVFVARIDFRKPAATRLGEECGRLVVAQDDAVRSDETGKDRRDRTGLQIDRGKLPPPIAR